MSAPTLTPVELAVLQRVADGLTRYQIGEEMAYSSDGVLRIIRRIYRKLGAVNAPHAVLLACRAGLLDGKPQQRHGDRPGFRAHERRGEEPCDACKAGEQAYRAQLRNQRKETAA